MPDRESKCRRNPPSNTTPSSPSPPQQDATTPPQNTDTDSTTPSSSTTTLVPSPSETAIDLSRHDTHPRHRDVQQQQQQQPLRQHVESLRGPNTDDQRRARRRSHAELLPHPEANPNSARRETDTSSPRSSYPPGMASRNADSETQEKWRGRKIVFLAGAPGTQAARHEQVALLIQRDPWGREVEMRCVYALPMGWRDWGGVGDAGDGDSGGRGGNTGEVDIGGGDVGVGCRGQEGAQRRREAREWEERRRVETLRAAVWEAAGGGGAGGGEGMEVVDDGASTRSARSGRSEGRGEKGVVVLIDGFPNTLSEARLFESVVGKPDCVLVFTGETGFLRKTLTRELQAKGKARERAKSFGQGASNDSNAGASRRRVVSEALTGQRWERRGMDDQKGAGEVAVEEEVDGHDPEVDGKEVERRLAGGWYLPLLEVSSRYTAELGPRMVAEVDVQKTREALYIEVVRVLQRVHGEVSP